MNLEQRTIEILAQVVYKEMKADWRNSDIKWEESVWWEKHQQETLELARNILRVNNSINPMK